MKLIITILFLALSINLQAGEFAISPMLIDVKGKPGSKQQFSFEVHGKKAGRVRVYFSYMKQLSSGHMDFAAMADADASISSWVKLDKQSFAVAEGETIKVGGELSLPRGESGNKLFAIMVEEDKVNQQNGINV